MAVSVGIGVVAVGAASVVSANRNAKRASAAATEANRESIAASERQTASLIEASKPTALELQLQQQNLEISKAQLGAIQQQTGIQQQTFDFTKQLITDAQAEQASINAILPPELKAQLERQQLEFAMELGPVQQEITKLQLERLKQGDKATPEQINLINQVTAGAKATGESDIDRATSMALEQLRDDFANASGLRPSDSPILDRAGRIQAEAVRSKGQLSAQLESGAANAKLNFPLMATSVLSGAGTVQQQFSQQVAQFQQQLREQAFQNRMGLATQFQNTGLNLANVGGGPFQFQQVQQQRGLGILGMRSGFPNLNVPQVGSGMNLGQLGQLAQGLGSAYAAFKGTGGA